MTKIHHKIVKNTKDTTLGKPHNTEQKKSAPNLPSHEFWRYSLRLYSKTAVKDICLALQNRYSANVNVILFCCWHATTGRGAINKNQMQRLLQSIEPWHRGITQGLRHLRNLLSNLPEQDWTSEIRKEILSHELTSEQIEQLLITHTLSLKSLGNHTTQQKHEDCVTSFHHYFTCIGITLDQEAYDLLRKLLAEVFRNFSDLVDVPQMSMQL